MSTQIQFRKGTTAEHATFTGANAEVTVDTTKKVPVVHDGVTAGGFPAQKELVSGSNIKTIGGISLLGSGDIPSTLADGSVTAAKLATDSVTNIKILDGAVSNTKLAANAVTQDKMADASVGTAEVIDANITPAKLSQPLTRATAINTTSGTSHDIAAIPSWVKRVTVILNEVSTNGTNHLLLQMGTSGGVENTGYASTVFGVSGVSAQSTSSTSGIVVFSASAAYVTSGLIQFVNISGNTWIVSGVYKNNAATGNSSSGSKTLSGVLDRIRLTTATGTDTFDAGSFNIIYE